MTKENESLLLQVKEHVKDGCKRACHYLGFAKMPEGYALMLNADRSHFYWLRYDGVESLISWNQWQAWKWAKKNAASRENRKEG